MTYKQKIKKILKEMNKNELDRVISLVRFLDAKARVTAVEQHATVYLNLEQLSIISMALLYYAEAIKEKNDELKV